MRKGNYSGAVKNTSNISVQFSKDTHKYIFLAEKRVPPSYMSAIFLGRLPLEFSSSRTKTQILVLYVERVDVQYTLYNIHT